MESPSPNVESEQHKERPRKSLSPYSISVGLRAVAEEMPASSDRRALVRLSDRIRSGKSLDDLLEDNRDLPRDLAAVVSAGVQTGKLPQLLEEYLTCHQSLTSVWRSFYASLLYPFSMLLVSMILMLVFFGVVIPDFDAIFSDFGLELPGLTVMILGFAGFVSAFWPLLAIGVILLGLFVVLRKYLPFKALRAKVFHSLPLIGKAQEMAASSEFCSRMSILVDCRLPLEEALRVTSLSLKDQYLAKIARRLAKRVESGETCDELARTTTGIHHSLANSFRWAKDPETYSDGLKSLASVFASQSRGLTNQIAIIIEPLTIFGIGTFVGITVIALFMPLIRLLSDLS
ncbi:type II secretion system F family protein [Thalassoglobus sp. JC818]|uniref:type II secretion system F family protein n=1 Tax=Thalassoglobus sp. JC818 TaxID=3232136 RepID=UPI0034582750